MEREELVRQFLDKSNIFAVVGASKNPEKYGHKVYKDLKESGYRVYPINPNTDKVLGERCYPSLKDLPEKPDVVDMVVKPEVTEKIAKECKSLGINKVWFQPGSESRKAIEFCKENGIRVLHGICVIVKRAESEKK